MNYNYAKFGGNYLQLSLLWFIISYAGNNVSHDDFYECAGNNTNYLPILTLGGQY